MEEREKGQNNDELGVGDLLLCTTNCFYSLSIWGGSQVYHLPRLLRTKGLSR